MRKFVALVALLAVGSVDAGGGVGNIVFDPSNFAKNTITAAQTVAQTARQAQAYVTQLQQYRAQLQQLQAMDPGRAAGLVDQNGSDLRDAREAARQVQNLYGSVTDLQSVFQRRLDMAKSMNLSWNEYVNREQAMLYRNQDSAIQRAREDIRVMDRVRRDYEFARTAEEKIPATAGTHEAMQLMNLQMNRVITQNAELMRGLTTAMAGGSSAEQQAQANEAKQRVLEERKNRQEVTRARREGDKAALDAWKASVAP
jgi:P-type conjugative transfer protein TrbJ